MYVDKALCDFDDENINTNTRKTLDKPKADILLCNCLPTILSHGFELMKE